MIPPASDVVTVSVTVATDPADLAWQRDALFDPALSEDLARLDRVPSPAGVPGAPADPSYAVVPGLHMTGSNVLGELEMVVCSMLLD